MEDGKRIIGIPDDALEVLRGLKANRPPTKEEMLWREAVGVTLGVPRDWKIDLEAGAFVRPIDGESRRDQS